MASGSESPGDDYFNDLSQQPPESNGPSAQQARKNSGDVDSTGDNNINTHSNNGNASKQKRIACVVCRKRKLRCDGEKPSCGTCKRLAHDCAYDEVRRKSGPKRGYVKALEARLAQVETLLKDQNVDVSNKDGANAPSTDFATSTVHQPGLSMVPEAPNILIGDAHNHGLEAIARPTGRSDLPNPDAFAGSLGDMSIDQQGDDSFPWEMIGLGLEEPLPNQETINELHQIYFDRVHPSQPLIHRPRYLAALNLSPQMRPPISLRYMIWCLAATITDKYEGMATIFYERARKYLQSDEMRGHGESIISVANCQAWVLATVFEFKNMYFPRAWLSAARACKLAQMMGLHRLDGEGLDVKQCIPPPRDWTEREERRRTFWACFASDRYASIGTGWPMTVDEKDIMTNLPSTEEAFVKSKPQRSMTLEQALTPTGASSLSPFSGVIVLSCLFGRNLLHLHRPGPDDNDDDLNGEFWKRHRNMEQILLNTSLALPDHLRLPSGIGDPNIIFLNMNIHTSAICLHQAAIFKADKNRLPTNISAESKIRCITAAAQIASIMRMISHMDLSAEQIQHDVVCAPIFEVRDHQAQASNPATTQQPQGGGIHGNLVFSGDDTSFDQFSTSAMPNVSAATYADFSYTMDFDATGQSIARGPPHFSLGTSNTGSPTMDLPSRQRSPFMQNQGPQQKSPFMQSRNNSPFLPSQQRNPMDLTPGDGDGMDTSPDSHSGIGDQATPSTQHSQHASSSRTSTSYSPHQRTDETLPRCTNPPTAPDNFSSGGDAHLFGTRQEFEDFTAQLYSSNPSATTSNIRNDPHRHAGSTPGSNSNGNSGGGGGGAVGSGPGVASVVADVTAGFAEFSDWNLDTAMAPNAQTGYLSTGLTPGGPGSGDWSQMLEGMNGWEGMR
ncbi:MAG: hypothetical protein M1821_003510 [Bathelium mastoideum]|nr:MAG: hypothetical protein M1821_003510 [Bathelium mastoideum]